MDIISKVLSIVIIDLALSGDNAAVIGLAIRNLPDSQRKWAAIIGTGGALVLRIIFTILAALLLSINYISFIGGIILIFITWKLIREDDGGEDSAVGASTKFLSAVGTIIIADLSMAFDNVMGVAGAAEGHVPLIIFGLLVSIPILIIGSTWLAKVMKKYPIIIYIGAGVLVHTASKMIINDKGIALMNHLGGALSAAIPIVLGLLSVLGGYIKIKRQENNYAAKRAN